MWAPKIPKKMDRMRGERSQKTNSEEYKKKYIYIMAKKRSLSGGKKDKGAGTNLDRSEGCRGMKIGTI